jgi:hypothetical protein
VEQKGITFIQPSIIQEKIAITNEHSSSSYIADCWHPPETV